jgi:hypothetical protein
MLNFNIAFCILILFKIKTKGPRFFLGPLVLCAQHGRNLEGESPERRRSYRR